MANTHLFTHFSAEKKLNIKVSCDGIPGRSYWSRFFFLTCHLAFRPPSASDQSDGQRPPSEVLHGSPAHRMDPPAPGGPAAPVWSASLQLYSHGKWQSVWDRGRGVATAELRHHLVWHYRWEELKGGGGLASCLFLFFRLSFHLHHFVSAHFKQEHQLFEVRYLQLHDFYVIVMQFLTIWPQ